MAEQLGIELDERFRFELSPVVPWPEHYRSAANDFTHLLAVRVDATTLDDVREFYENTLSLRALEAATLANSLHAVLRYISGAEFRVVTALLCLWECMRCLSDVSVYWPSLEGWKVLRCSLTLHQPRHRLRVVCTVRRCQASRRRICCT